MRSPIGIFDSGLGGLSVAARVMRILPRERIIYFADTAHVPYGERPLAEINGFALDITRFLIEEGAKAIVMACNMSSAIALDEACTRWPDIGILGVIEPGARAAVEVANGRPIGVLATTGTVKSEAYVRAIEREGGRGSRRARPDRRSRDPGPGSEIPDQQGVAVVQQPCPRFVPLVESGLADSEEAEAAAVDYLAPLRRAGCGTIILGCTHYPFLRRAIESAAGPEVTIVDPAEETAHALAKTLYERGLESEALDAPHVFYASGDTCGFAELGSRFLGTPIEEVISRQLSVVSARTNEA